MDDTPASDWVTITNLAEWSAFNVSVQADFIGNRLSVTALRIEPKSDSIPVSITAQQLRRLPLRRLASDAFSATNTWRPVTPRRLMVSVARRGVRPHDARATTTVEQVAEVYRLAVEAGYPNPREQVCKSLHVSRSTADRYLRRARDQGRLVDPSTKQPTNKQAPTKRATTRRKAK